MENMTDTVETETKRVTWKDFTLEEHIQGYMGGLPRNCILQIKTIIEDKVFRVNIFNSKTETFLKSEAIRVIITPDGYIFEPWKIKERDTQ